MAKKKPEPKPIHTEEAEPVEEPIQVVRPAVHYAMRNLRGLSFSAAERDALLEMVMIGSHLLPRFHVHFDAVQGSPDLEPSAESEFSAEQEPAPGSIFSTPADVNFEEWVAAFADGFARYGSPLSVGQRELITHALNAYRERLRASMFHEIAINVRASSISEATSIEALETAVIIRDNIADALEKQGHLF